MADEKSYEELVDPDETSKLDLGETPDDVPPVADKGRPYVGQLGDDRAEAAREEIGQWNEKNLDN